MVEYSAYVGLNVHKETISVAVALAGREDPVFRGEIRNQRSSLRRLVGRLSPDGEVISFCYEAGPCGGGVYWTPARPASGENTAGAGSNRIACDSVSRTVANVSPYSAPPSVKHPAGTPPLLRMGRVTDCHGL